MKFPSSHLNETRVDVIGRYVSSRILHRDICLQNQFQVLWYAVVFFSRGLGKLVGENIGYGKGKGAASGD